MLRMLSRLFAISQRSRLFVRIECVNLLRAFVSLLH
eukprot:XP_001704799.1 Hypothetical protein GL50803_38652 [Giardia lamblia ATCC 50803]